MRIKFGLIEFLYFTLVAALCNMFLHQYFQLFNLSNWDYSEFLINYQGGFVRRGLIGEIIYQSIANNIIQNNPILVIKIISYIAFILLSISMYFEFIRSKHSIFLLPMSFVLGFPVVCFFWVRKDSIILLFLIISLYLMKKNKYWCVIIVSILIFLSTLIHDSTLFVFTPIFLLLIFKEYKFNAFFSYAIILCGSLLVLLRSGTNEIVSAIHSSWLKLGHVVKPVRFIEQNIDNAIDALSWSLSYAIKFTADTYYFDNDNILHLVHWVVIIVLIFIIVTNIHQSPKILFYYNYLDNKINSNENKSILFMTALFQLFFIIPLFIVGIDYGRWIFMWSTSTLMIYLIQLENLKYFLNNTPNYLLNLSYKYYEYFDRLFYKYPHLYSIICFLIGLTGVGVIGDDALKTAPILIVLGYLHTTFRTIYFMF